MDPLCYLCKTSPMSHCRSCNSLAEARREVLEEVEGWLRSQSTAASEGVLSFLSQQMGRYRAA